MTCYLSRVRILKLNGTRSIPRQILQLIVKLTLLVTDNSGCNNLIDTLFWLIIESTSLLLHGVYETNALYKLDLESYFKVILVFV